MSRTEPYDVFPELVYRSSHILDMKVKDRDGILKYKFWGAKTLDDAYGNPTGVTGPSGVAGAGPAAMFEVRRSSQFRSPSIIKRHWAWYGESLRGMSRVAFTMDDYSSDPTTDLPSDTEPLYVRVQQSRQSTGGYLVVQGPVNTGLPKLGPIYCVPTVTFFGQPNPVLTVQGTAPGNTGCVAGQVPRIHPDMQDPNPLHVVLPRWATAVTIINHDASEDLLVSSGLDAAMSYIKPSEDPAVIFGGFKEIVLASVSGSPVSFTVYATVSV